MGRPLSASIRTGVLGSLRWLARRAETAGGGPPAFLARRLEQREERLFAALGGMMSFQLLRTAYDVGLFRLLHERPGLVRDEIAEALGLRVYAVEILLLGLVPMKLVERVGDRYYNDPILSGLLSGELFDGGLGKIVDYFHRIINPAVLHLEESVRRGEPVGLRRLFGDDATSFYGALCRDEALGACFEAAMRADTALNLDRIASSEVFAGRTRLLDVGGNTGELAMAIAAHHPELRITVLDFPAVATRATERFQVAGLGDRLDARGGDFLEEAFPSGYDGVVFAHVLDIFSPEKVRRLLCKAHDCLPEGGTALVFGSAMADDEAGPLMYGVLSAYFLCLADGEGRFYTAAQTAAAMRGAGFVEIEKTALPRSEVLLRGKKPRAPSDVHGPKDTSAVVPPRGGFVSKLSALAALGRPKFLVYSLVFYGLGSAAAVHEGRAIDFARWIHGLLFVWSAHLMTHACNDYFDLEADAANRAPTQWTGGSRVLVEGRLRPVVGLAAAFVLLFVALGLGLAMPDAWTRWLAFSMLALAWFYTAPPLRLNHRGLGEVTVAVVLCVLVPLLGHGLAGGRPALPPVLLGALFPVFVIQVARMIQMNLSDRAGDEVSGKRTLAVVLGPGRAREAVALGQVVAYVALAALTLSGVLPAPVGVAMLLTLPLSAWQTRRLFSGALSDPGQANSVVFWASTHVALCAVGALGGLLVATASAPPPVLRALGASLALSTAILVVFGALLALQILRHGAPARRLEEGTR